jgi:hypothetical protein
VDDLKIFAVIGTEEHTNEQVYPGYSLFLRAKDDKEQDILMREVALAVRGDVVKLSNGLFLILTADR